MTKLSRFALVAALFALPAAAQAQVTASASINASATIGTVLDFSSPVDLTFGSITPNTAAIATGSILLTRNTGVLITLPDGVNTGRLSNGAPTPVYLQPTYTCGWGTVATAFTTAFSSCAPAVVTTTVGTRTTPAGVATDYIVFTGSLTAAQTNINPGTYTGAIKIFATAN